MDVTTTYLEGGDRAMEVEKIEDIYRCPVVLKSRPGGYGYAFNRDLSGKALAAFTPEQERDLPLLYDTNDLRRNANASGWLGLSRPPRHKEGNPICYLDGPVRILKQPPP